MDQVKHIAMACEMIHTASLVHDDIIDKSDTRRNKESINSKWGQKRSVVGGDYIVAMATKLIATNRDPQVVDKLHICCWIKDISSKRCNNMYCSNNYHWT